MGVFWSGRHTREQPDGARRWPHRTGWQVVAVVLLAAAILVVPRLGLPLPGDTAGRTPSPAESVSEARQPPNLDTVLRLRDELAAASDDADYPISPADLAAVPTAPGEYTPLGRISIPGAGVETAFAAGIHPSVLERGPGHWPGTAMPGQPGNAVLSGHRTTYTKPFADLDALVAGDPVSVQMDGGNAPVVFRVFDTSIVPEAEYREFVLRPPPDPAAREITLFACHPEGDRTHRIVVRARAEAPDGTTGEEGR